MIGARIEFFEHERILALRANTRDGFVPIDTVTSWVRRTAVKYFAAFGLLDDDFAFTARPRTGHARCFPFDVFTTGTSRVFAIRPLLDGELHAAMGDADAYMSGYPMMDTNEWRRAYVVVRKLPEMRKQLLALEARLKKLEEK